MKIAISTAGAVLEDPIDSRFGRAPKFIIYDSADDSFELIDNAQNLNAAQGAGIQSAQNVAAYGVQAVITGHTGPKAFRVLNEAGIDVYYAKEVSAGTAINLFLNGKLTKAENADVEGHW